MYATIAYCTLCFKVRAVSCHIWLKGPLSINLAVEHTHTYTHTQGGKHIVIISHSTKVASLISAGMNGQKSTQLKSEQISEKVTQSIMRHFRR